MNGIFSDSKLHHFKANSYPKLNMRQRKNKSADISLASWLLRCLKDYFKSNDILQHTDRVVVRNAYIEAAKYF